MAYVAFVDDEHGPIDYYLDALKAKGHQVQRLDTVEDLFAHLAENKPADIYVVDILMPTHGHPQLKEASDGLATGIVLHREIRRAFQDVPIIMLTSISNPDVLEGLTLEANTRVESKIDTLPFELADIVDSALNPCHSP